MAVTGFVFGMVLLCALGVGMAAAGIIWLVVQRKSRQAKERKGRLVLPILLLIMGLLCAGLPGGYFAAISHAKGEREQSRGALVTAIEKTRLMWIRCGICLTAAWIPTGERRVATRR